MKTALVLVLVLVAAAAAAFFALRKGGKLDRVRESPIRLCVLFGQPVSVDPRALADEFEKRWNIEAVCKEDSKSSGEQGAKAYTIATKTCFAMITCRPEPLDGDLVTLTLSSCGRLSDAQRKAVTNHKACVTITYVGGPRQPVQQAKFAAQVLSVVMRLPGSLGYVSINGQAYHPAEQFDELLKGAQIDEFVLFMLLTVVHDVDEEPGCWMHTHGMEQFGCPDIEVRFADSAKKEYYYNLIGNIALYMMEKGPVMKPGHTGELAGDGVIYEIRAARVEPGHDYGRHGALELAVKVGTE